MDGGHDNDLLALTGPDTPGGAFLRRYWQPVALCREIESGAPIPVKILGEDLVLFRDESGRLGLLGLHCPHRCADLSYGRIEGGGIRCLYHGWLFDVAGRCLETPAEPAGSSLKDAIRHTSYPCHEAAGAVFAYLGPGAPPLFPEFHFITAPAPQVHQSKVYQHCNYLQANEGNIDPVHLSFLHSSVQPLVERKGDYGTFTESLFKDNRPSIEIERTRFGVRIFARRLMEDGKAYLRVTNYVVPNLSFFPGSDQAYGEGGYTVHWHVPADDESNWRFEFYFHAKKPLDKEQMRARVAGEKGEGFALVRNAGNRFGQDRTEMANDTYTGMGKLFVCHDAFAVESPGAIHDRSREHLGSTDVAITAARRMMSEAIEGLAAGDAPPLDLRAPADNAFNDIIVLSRVVDAGEDPRTHCAAIIDGEDFHGRKG
jgi:phenylpropionate dioxygenase-like ring-hydroxylating dioxygenase large terminal subunit